MLLSRLVAAAGGLAALAAVAVVYRVDSLLTDLGRADLRQGGGAGVAFMTAIFVSAGVGGALLLRRPEHPVGWCFSGLALAIALAAISQSYGVYGVLARPGQLRGAASAATVASSTFVLWLIFIARICSLTPTGLHLSRRWRRADQVMMAAGLLWLVTIVLSPGKLQAPFQNVENRWGLQDLHDPLALLRLLSGLVNNILVLVAVLSLGLRFKRARGDERRQLLWMAVFAVPFPVLLTVAFVASNAHNGDLVNLVAAGLVSLLPLGAGLAVSRYHLYDVDRILSRALAYLLVSALLAGTYLAVVVLVARAFGQTASRSPVAVAVATLGVAAAARPIYATVQDAVDRRFFRRRYDALNQVRAFVAAPTPQLSVETVLRTALHDTSLTVAYWVDERQDWVTEQGHPAHPRDSGHPVHRAGRKVAVIGSASDPELVRVVAGEAAAELDNAGLRAAVSLQLEEVRASRRRIAAAQVTERQRVERDLHDGAQQRLLGLAAHLQAGLLNGTPERLQEALTFGVAECRAAVIELRELANGLHPSVLSDGGLTAALDDLAGRLPITLRLDLPRQRYPEPIEATAWFVVREAVANALKHAGRASIEVVVLEVGDCLQVTVIDDGSGGADATGPGLRGLADRAEATGGTLHVLPGPTGGTQIEAVLPCG